MKFEEWESIVAKNETDTIRMLLRNCWDAAFMQGQYSMKQRASECALNFATAHELTPSYIAKSIIKLKLEET